MMWMYNVTVGSPEAQLWARGWPGWVFLEGEEALAQSPGQMGVSGSGHGHPEHSGPHTPKGFPS